MKIKVFTMNLRTESRGDGINYFPNRQGRILDTIRTHTPDIIGFQEVTDNMRRWLVDALDGYTVLGCGRGSGFHGESTSIAYRKGAFELLWLENFWLSLTPTVPGSTYRLDQSACPRIATAALLAPLSGEAPFVFCNTHLDHRGKTARLLGSVQLLQYLTQKPEGFILTGDFNAPPGTPEIEIITSVNSRRIVDATAGLPGTFHGFGRVPDQEKSKIDYIFTDLPCDTSESFVVPDIPEEGVYISDHNPVCAFIEV
ncbi:MAG TPA: endonuclease/exonuclease/phosphatase family protein [Clostridiales bacterium]|jgi:endonuclease/exonuclease/phosphatase family metal-dependent hydrolase|nr:endonuclease/exonuclease/phosphatase family protein [Clostridiales bacterium]